MSERWPEYPRPRYWSDPDQADIADAAEDAHRQELDESDPESWPDVEWSSEQTFAGEFGITNQFGDPID